MVVTGIVEVTGCRSKIYIDDTFAFVLYKGELRKYQITEGKEITQNIVDEILGTILPKRAKLRSMSLLRSRPYTEKQMQDKLKQAFYPEEVIAEAIDYLKSFGYIDDLQYAQDYIEYHSKNKSRKQLELNLIKKGIGMSVVRKAFLLWGQAGGDIDENLQIFEWIRKKGYNVNTSDLKEKQKMMAFLFRKGFDTSSICKALNCEEFS